MSAIPKAKKPAFEIGRETRLDLFRHPVEPVHAKNVG
jgi:hypothetical protein